MNFNQLGLYFDKNAIQYDYNPQIERIQFTGNFYGLKLNSVYQPILSLKERSIVAHEALVRAYHTINGEKFLLPVHELFNSVSDSEQLILLDRLCRAIHSFNFVEQNKDISSLLFLNISPRHLLSISHGHGHFFEKLLKLCDLNPNRIVLEILESEIEDKNALAEIVNNYQQLGYQIAIDDFGVSHSNFDRLWLLNPDIVKIDRSILVQAETSAKVRRVLKKLVEIIHELGSQVVIEGIETYEQFSIAEECGAEFAQGFYLSRPQTSLIESEDLSNFIRNPFAWAIGL